MSLLRLVERCIVILALVLPIQAAADIYVYVDERGVKHYTNTPTAKNYKLASLPRLNTPRSNTGHPGNGSYRNGSSAFRDPYQYDKHIAKAADMHKLDPLLIKAVIKAESDFDQYATSSKGAQGLMQLMPETARDLMVANPYNPSQNINGGARYLKKLLDSYEGDLVRCIAAYNAGPGRVPKKGPLPKIKETRDYVRKVSRYYQMYRQAGYAGEPSKLQLNKLVTVN